MMARIAMHEGHRQRQRLPPAHAEVDKIANPHPEHVAIKVQALLAIVGADHDMAESHRAGLEPGNQARRPKRRLVVHQRSKVRLARNSAPLLELDQLHDATRLLVFWCTL